MPNPTTRFDRALEKIELNPQRWAAQFDFKIWFFITKKAGINWLVLGEEFIMRSDEVIVPHEESGHPVRFAMDSLDVNTGQYVWNNSTRIELTGIIKMHSALFAITWLPEGRDDRAIGHVGAVHMEWMPWEKKIITPGGMNFRLEDHKPDPNAPLGAINPSVT